MKKYIFLLLLILLIILTIFKVDAKATTFPLLGKKIILDFGHGGKDKGASIKNTYEKDLNLEIGLKLKKELEGLGANIELTRSADYDLSKPDTLFRKKSDFDNRIAFINNSAADLYLSIHMNYYGNSKYYGPQVFYAKNNQNIANIIQRELNVFTKTSREAKIIKNVYMYDKLNIKGCLIECGFLSNPKELKNLLNEDYQKNLAKTISKAIIKYYN